MTIQWIAILLGVLLCAAVLAIILLCGLLGQAMSERLKAEQAARQAYSEVDMLSKFLGRKYFREFHGKAKAASGTNTDGKQ